MSRPDTPRPSSHLDQSYPISEAATVPPAQRVPPDSETGTFPPAPPSIESLPVPPSTSEGTSAASVRVPGYEILGELGRGGMGVVYRARQTGLRRVIALKMILSAQHATDSERERFRREAEM